MGVRGLFKELERRGLRRRQFVATPDAMRALGPAQRHIVIDACSATGFIHNHLMYGGEFLRMESKIRGYVHQFVAAGFRVTAVIDGALDAAKRDEWLQRRVTELRRMSTIHVDINTANRAHRLAKWPSNAEMACVPNWKSLVAELFMGAGCEVVMSPVEADREAAGLCVLSSGFGVISNDSDMLVFGLPRVVNPDTIRKVDGRLALEYFDANDISRALGIPTSLMPLFASLAGNDFVPTCAPKLARHSPSKAGPSGPESDAPVHPITVVADFMAHECAEGRIKEGCAEEWLDAVPFLSDKVKGGIRQSMQQYTIKTRTDLILEKSGPFALKSIQLWDSYQHTKGVSPMKLLYQVVADRAVFESACMELGMPVSVWAITEELRHNLYDLVLAPIRDTAPCVKEVVISPLESCRSPSEPYVPKFSFVDEFRVPVVPGEPIAMFVFTAHMSTLMRC